MTTTAVLTTARDDDDGSGENDGVSLASLALSRLIGSSADDDA
jgi:hypothetical protein